MDGVTLIYELVVVSSGRMVASKDLAFFAEVEGKG